IIVPHESTLFPRVLATSLSGKSIQQRACLVEVGKSRLMVHLRTRQPFVAISMLPLAIRKSTSVSSRSREGGNRSRLPIFCRRSLPWCSAYVDLAGRGSYLGTVAGVTLITLL